MLSESEQSASVDLKPPSTQPIEHSRWAHLDRWWLLLVAAIGLVALLYLLVPDPYADILQFLRDGVLVTLQLTIVSFFFILIVGMLGGLGHVSSNKLISGIASLYVEVVRGIPVLVWLLWIWFALPQLLQALGGFLVNVAPAIGNWMLGIRLDPYSAAILGFTFAYGAYMTEVFRAGIQSIPKGQMEAARSLGMTYIQAMRYIILPQAVKVIVPPVSNEFITLLKDSSLVSILAVSDLTRRGREYVARTFMSFETFTMVALVYLILTVFFTRISSALERQMAVERKGTK